MDKLVEANQRALDLQYMLDSAQQEIERLRAALAHELDLRNRHIESLEARIKELEALNESLMENGNDLRARCWKAEGIFNEYVAERNKEAAEKDLRIKELESEITAWIADRDSWIARYEAVREEKDARIADQEAYIERLEEALLKLYVNQLVGCNMPREFAEKHASEELEGIKEGGKDD